jgi:phage minor structural protein
MIPILFSPSEELSLVDRNHLSNGLGRLKESFECYTDTVLNGDDELTLVYPMNGRLFSQIQDRSIIVAYNSRLRKLQPYRVYRQVQNIDGIVTFYAEHISYDLVGIPVYPYEAVDVGTTLAGIPGHSAIANPFTFTTDKTTTAPFRLKHPVNARMLLGGVEGSILDTYHGEYEFDWYDVILHNHRGMDRGVRITYGKNMTDFEQDRNCTNCYTGAVGYYLDPETNECVHTQVVNVEGTFDHVKIATLDFSDRFETTPTVEQLTDVLSQYITNQQIGIPEVSWKLEFEQLENFSDFDGLDLFTVVDLGDTVHVYFERMGVEATARVNETRWNVLQDRYESVYLGSIKAKITDTINDQESQLDNTPTEVEVENIAAKITAALTKALFGLDGGVIRFLDTNEDGVLDTLYIADDPNPLTAVKVWRFNYQGFAASKNGYDGPFEFGATLDDGLLANFVTAAKLVAGTIQSADGTTFYLNLDEGILQMGNYYSKDETDAEIGRFVRIQDGRIYIGLEGNNIQLVESNDKVAFVDKASGTEVAYISNDRFYTPNLTVLQTADFGGYRMDVSNGIGFKWIGRE